MARTDSLNNFLTDVADAIRIKTGSTEQIQASQFDTEIESINTGITPNGIIESYYAYAGENISAGDFVQFINGTGETIDYGTSVDTQVNTEKNTSKIMSAAELSDNRVFITYGNDSTYLYGVIITINNSTISVGTSTKLGDDYTGRAASVALLKDGRVFIAHSSGSGSTPYLYGMVCTVNGTTITKVYDQELFYGTDLRYHTNIETIVLDSDNNDVFVACCGNSSSYDLKMIVCRLEENSLSKGTQVTQGYSGGDLISATLLSDGRICIVHNYTNGSLTNALYGKIVTVNNLTITMKGFIINPDSYTSMGAKVETLDEERFLVTRKWSENTVYGCVCSIAGDTVTVGTEFELLARSHDCASPAIPVRLSSGKVLLVYSRNSTNQYLYGVVCTVQDMTITAGTPTALIDTVNYSGAYRFPLLLSKGNILIIHSANSTYSLNAQLFSVLFDIPTNQISAIEYETQVKVATSIPFDGVAKTSGIGGTEDLHNERVEIYTLQE